MIRTAPLFREICEALWGAHWRTVAAAELGIHRNSLRRYASRERRIPAAVWDRLVVIWDSRGSKISRLNAIMADWRL